MRPEELLQENISSLETLLEQDEKARPKLVDFIGVKGFTDEETRKDMEEEESLKREYRKRESGLEEKQIEIINLGRMAEHLVLKSIEEARWLGKEVRVLLPTIYDDYTSHIDGIAERGTERDNVDHVAISFDFTISRGEIREKIENILRGLQYGLIPTVKYFSSPIIGKIYDFPLPRVVIGLEMRTVKRLADEYTEAHEVKSAQFQKDYEDDPAQYVILSEIIFQLKVFGDFVFLHTRDVKKRDFFHKPLERLLETLKERKVDTHILMRHSRGDSVHGQIVNIINLFTEKKLPIKHLADDEW